MILIANYGGHPSYNAYHTVTVINSNSFSIPVPFVDDHASKGLWATLTDGGRLSATSLRGAAVALEIRRRSAHRPGRFGQDHRTGKVLPVPGREQQVRRTGAERLRPP